MKDKDTKHNFLLCAAAVIFTGIFLGISAVAWKKGVKARKAEEEASSSSKLLHRTFYDLYVKRAIDIVLAFLGLVITAPLLLLVAAAIWIDDPGPVIFTQKRVGIHKTYFYIHKFRSMKMSAPKDVPTHLFENPEQYITRVGKILRRYSLDELPQLWDIFCGYASLVGPRMALWNQYDLVEERDKYGANDIRPGLTGWAQINGRDELEIPVKAAYDGVYTEKLTKSSISGFLMDMRCILGTIRPVMKAEGFVEGGTGSLDGDQDSQKPEE